MAAKHATRTKVSYPSSDLGLLGSCVRIGVDETWTHIMHEKNIFLSVHLILVCCNKDSRGVDIYYRSIEVIKSPRTLVRDL